MTHLMNAAASTSISSTCRGFAGVAMAAHDRASRPHTRLCSEAGAFAVQAGSFPHVLSIVKRVLRPAALARRSWTEHCDEFANTPREIHTPPNCFPVTQRARHCPSHQNAITAFAHHSQSSRRVRGVVHQVAHHSRDAAACGRIGCT